MERKKWKMEREMLGEIREVDKRERSKKKRNIGMKC